MRRKGMHKKLASILVAAAMVMTSMPVYAATPDGSPEAVVVEEAAGSDGDAATPDADNQGNGEVENAVAEIDGTRYESLSEAIEAAKNGQTVKLLGKQELSETLKVENKGITLDLNGQTISSSAEYPIEFIGSDSTICDNSETKTGKIVSSSNGTRSCAVHVQKDASLTVTGGIFGSENQPYGIRVLPGGKLTFENGKVQGNIAGIVAMGSTESKAVLSVTGGEIFGEYYAVAGNGLNDNTEIIINGGSLTSGSLGIYHPQEGNLTISGNAKIEAPNGVQYCGSGQLTISDDAEIYATGAYTPFPSKPAEQGDGSTDDGAALSLISRGAGYQDNEKTMKVTINGGTLISDNNAAISAYRLQQTQEKQWVTNENTTLENFLESLKITGGTISGITSTENKKPVLEIDGKAVDSVEISGGTYNQAIPEAYCAEGYVPVANGDGSYSVQEDRVAEINGQAYSTLQKAIDAAEGNVTIKILSDITSTKSFAISAEKNICLDLNNHTIEVKGQNAFNVEGILEVKDSSASKQPEVSDDYSVADYQSGEIKGVNGIVVHNGGKVTLTNGKVSGTNLGISVNGNQNPEGENRTPIDSVLTVNGGYIKAQEFAVGVYGAGAKSVINDGVMETVDNAAVAGNGTKSVSRWDGGTEIVINGGTMISNIKSQGYIACGVYHPQAGSLKINGGDIYAKKGMGVLMRGGTLEMTGGNVTASGTDSGKVGDSTIVQNCYGIQIDGQSKYYDHGNTKVTISGGNISADPSVDVLSVVDVEPSRMQVSGGIYTGKVENSKQFLAARYDFAKIDENTYEVVKKSFEEKDAIESVTAVVKTTEGNVVDSEDVAVTITENELMVTGKVTGDNEVELTYHSVYGKTGTVTITKAEGGSFTVSPEEVVLPEGKTYKVDVSGLEILPENTILEVEAPQVHTDAGAGEEEDIEKVVEALEKVNITGLAASASEKIDENGSVTTEAGDTLSQVEAREALEKQGIAVEGEEVSLVVSTYLDIQIEKVVTSEDGKKEVILDITPKYVVKATIAENADGMIESEQGKNTVPITEAQELTVNEAVAITLPIPKIFTAQENIFVEHKADARTYYYATKVEDDKITFVNPNGFSEFILKQDGRTGVINFGDMGSRSYNLSNVGESLPVPAVPEGQYFIGWEIDGTTYTTLTNDLLNTIDGKRVVATPKFGSNSSGGGGGITTPSYTITAPAETERGKVTASSNSANQGTTVTLTVEPKEGYELDELTVTDASGAKVELTQTADGKFTFQMPGSNVEIKATFKVEGQQEQEIVILKAQARDLADRTLNDKDTKVKFAKGKAPKTDVTYATSNDKVVAVDEDGHIHYTGLGEAVITVKAVETEEYKAAEVAVTVKVGLKQPTFTPSSRDNGFTVTSSTVKGAEKFQVQYVLKGRSFKHDSAKSKTFTVDNKLRKGKVSAANKKTYRIRVRAISGDFKSKWSPVKTISTK